MCDSKQDKKLKYELLRFEYAETHTASRHLVDLRFRLLALATSVSGISIALLVKGSDAQGIANRMSLPLGLLGFIITVGVVIYDQRNSQIHNAMLLRLKELGSLLSLSGSGQFPDRPLATLKIFGVIRLWHDRGLALIYGSILGAWLFPVVYSALQLTSPAVIPPTSYLTAAWVAATVGAVTFVLELHRLDEESYPKELLEPRQPN